MQAGDGWVYLLHFARPLGLRRDRHYRGFTTDPERRFAEHRSPRSRSRYTRAFAAAGVAFEIAGVWPGGRAQEHAIKRAAARDICAICLGRPVPWEEVAAAGAL